MNKNKYELIARLEKTGFTYDEAKIHGWPEMVMLPESVLVKSQKRKLTGKHRKGQFVVPTVRWDDQCGNGHNSFSVTADIFEGGRDAGGGCCHELIEESHPELKHLIRWHLCSSDGPMHYLANTVYHALGHGCTHAWVYYLGGSATDPLGLGDDGIKERLLGYLKADEAKKAEGEIGYRVVWDEKKIKVRNLDHARSSACWPEATDEELMQEPEQLKAALIARLPDLMIQMYQDITNFGFTY